MSFRLWQQRAVDSLLPKQGVRRLAARQRTPDSRPRLEAFEDRTLLSVTFNSALNLDTYPWVRLHPGDPLLPQAPPGEFNWNQAVHPDSVAIGDFNGDGIPDIAVADSNAGAPSGEGQISVFLGNGDGSFAHTQPVVDLTTSPQTIRLLDSGGLDPSGLVVARLRGPNAPLDLIVANRGDSAGRGANVTVLRGNGDGSFESPESFYAGPFPSALAVSDLNGSGNFDVVVANGTVFPGEATVLFGDGNGGFIASSTMAETALSAGPQSVAAGDFGNGQIDFVVANSLSDNVTVFLGRGDGTFASAASYSTDRGPVSIAVAHLRGIDKPLDIITANNSGNDVSILFGNGDGTFSPPVNFDAGLEPTSVAVGNFDGLGRGLAVTSGQDNGTVSILGFNPFHFLPDNSDLLLPPISFRAGQDPVSVAAAPLRPSMTGVFDLVVANFGGTLDRGSVSVLLNQGLGVFPTPGSFPTGLQPNSVAVGDFNGDGLPDFVTANAGSNDLSVWLNDPQDQGNNFLPLTDLNGIPITLNVVDSAGDPIGIDPRKVVVGDFTGDGLPDIAVAYFGDFGTQPADVTVFLNTGDAAHPFANDPQFVVSSVFAAPDVFFLDMATGDFNGDGKLDLAVLSFDANTSRTVIEVLAGNGNGGSFAGPITLLPLPAGTNPASIAVADFNGDGRADIAVTNFQDDPNASSLFVLFGNGDFTFGSIAAYHAGSHVSSVAVAHLRGSGQPVDIIVANENFPGSVTVFLNKGDGTFPQTGTTYFAGTNPVALVIADLNGDGFPDIAVANVNGASVSVLISKGDGTFPTAVAYATGNLPTSIAAGDFFGHTDGRLDLITSDGASNDVSVIENIGTPPPPPIPSSPPRAEEETEVSRLTPSNLDHLFTVVGCADPEPAARGGRSCALTMREQCYLATRRHRLEDQETFSILLWEET